MTGRPLMPRRRFGRTEIQMPVLTCGGMRYQQSWKDDVDAANMDAGGQENLAACVQRAVNAGINHIETARGYGSSEYQLGLVLPQYPRDELIIQTKIGPQDSEAEFLKTFEVSMNHLKVGHIDLLAVHGINNSELLRKTLYDGTLSACRKLQDQGLVRHVGFSTHGVAAPITEAIETGEFDYVNLHWYFFDQANGSAITAATQQDMGVFIISPSDKGGKLYAPPDKLSELCAPLTPMGFNDLFCLADPQVHTLSLGVAKPSDFDAHLDILPQLDHASEAITPIAARLQQAVSDALGRDWATSWSQNLPLFVDAPQTLPLYQILRMYTMAKAFDMIDYGKMRYNLLGNGDHWFPGSKADSFDREALLRSLADYPFADRVPDILTEAHALFAAEDVKRQSES